LGIENFFYIYNFKKKTKSHMRRFLTLFTVLMLSGILALAQNRVVSGTVTDDKGQPVEGASIKVKGAKTGTAADLNGSYSISVPANATLVISGVGITQQEVAVGNRTTVDVTVTRNVGVEATVVVTALGIRRSDKALGYSVTKVDPNVVLQKSEPDMLKGLQGKVPGVDIRSSQGTPGSATRIQIRGVSSFNLETQPLFVVDGVPYSNNSLSTSNQETAGGAYGSGISDLDPNDIESFNVLKGAAAAALYGSRASRGVIVITTKSGSGKKGAKPLNVNLKSSVSFETIANLPDYQNEFGTGAENRVGGGSNGSWGGRFGSGNVYDASGNVVRKSSSGIDSVPAWGPYLAAYPGLFDANGRTAYQAYPNNVKDLFKTGVVYENSLGVNGGDANSSVGITLSRTDHKGYVENSSFKKTNLSIGGQTKYKNWTFGANFAYTKSKQVGGFFGIAQAFTTQFGRSLIMGRSWPLPYLPPTDIAGRPLAFIAGQYTNPLWGAYHNTITTFEDRTVVGFRAAYKVNNWINVMYNIGSNITGTDRDEIIDLNSPGVGNGLGQITEDHFKFTELQSTLILAFNPKIGNNLSLDFKVGNDFNDRRSRRQADIGSGFVVPGIYNLINTSTKTFAADSKTSRRIVGIFGDATLGYKNYAFLNLSARNDFTSTLPFENSSYFYPGVSASFVFSDAFGIKSNIFDYGKVRAGWAKVGNDANPNNGEDVYTISTTNFLGQPYTGRSSQTIDPNLSPEFTSEIEVGADLNFFKRRIGIDFTWYDKRSTDLIYPIDVPVTTGYTSFQTNIGEIKNTGVELGVNLRPIISKNFTWDVRAAFTHNENTVLSLYPGLIRTNVGANGYNYIEPGFPYGYLRGTKAKKTDDGQFLIEGATGWVVKDAVQQMIGNPEPDFKLGITNTFQYKGFTLSALWDWTKGGDFYSETMSSLLGRGVTKDTRDRETGFVVPGVYADPSNPQTALLVGGKTVPNQTRISTNDLYFSTSSVAASFAINGINEFQTFDGTVYRLRELTFGYEVPKSITNKLKLGGVVFSVSGRNLWFFAPHLPRYTNFDPEANSLGSGVQQGVELSAAPTTRRIGVNLNITF
jgi:TonB-linked SusC/RagA family outer membrane protein